MRLDLMQTYHTLVLIEEFTEKLEQTHLVRKQHLVRGIVSRAKLKRIFGIVLIGLALLFLLLNLVLHDFKVSTFFFFPVHLFESLKWSLGLVIGIVINNQLRKRVNLALLQKQSFKMDMEYYETNLKALHKALTYSVVPKNQQTLAIVEKIIKGSTQ